MAVAPTTPARRPAVEGGFDFFGTKNAESEDGTSSSEALEAVQNEDLADVVGRGPRPAQGRDGGRLQAGRRGVRGVGQVIDLTAHDETEQIDVQRLRSAVS